MDLKTDLVPAIEFTAARVSVHEAPPTEGGAVVGSGEVGVSGQDFVAGTRLAEVAGLRVGRRYYLRTELVASDGTTALSQLTVVELRSALLGVTVLMGRDCVENGCEGEPGAVGCLSGLCVPPECTRERSDDCAQEPECVSDADCSAGASCAVAACQGGACFDFPSDDCGAGRYCDPESGCRAIAGADGGPADGGPVDGGPAPCPDPGGDTVALWTFDGSLDDAVSARSIVAAPADYTFVAGPGGCGQALEVGGAMPELRIEDDAAWDLSEGSIELWFRAPESGSGAMALFSRDHSGADPPGQIQAQLIHTGELFVRIQAADADEAIRCSRDAVSVGEWHHLGINFGSPGFEAWLDGEPLDRTGTIELLDRRGDPLPFECGSSTVAGLSGSGLVLPWFLGANNGFSTAGTTDDIGDYFTGGLLDDFRISAARQDFAAP